MEINFSISWEGEAFDTSGKKVGLVRGKMTVPELEHDTNIEKMQIDVSCNDSSEAQRDKLLKAVQTEGRAWLRGKAEILLQEMKDVHSVQEKKKV